MTRYKRRRKIIEPRLQLKFALMFFTTAGIALLVQAVMFSYMFDRAARSLENDGSALLSQLPVILRDCFLLTVVVLVPVTLVVGIQSTFRIVGPLYRFRVFLTSVMAGDQKDPCRIRAGDELHDFCDLLNRVTAPLREAADRDERTAAAGSAAQPEAALPHPAQAERAR
jgi:hypothetical protein